jgi:alcohol dehydrogenase class IV
MANPSVTADNLDSLKNIMSDASLKVPADMNPATTPLICIPTTLSAGEYSGFAAATDPRDHTKRIFVHPPSITPSVVILDPVLGRMSPAEVWFPSGVRAMDHCIELLCRLTHPDPDVDESAKKGLVLLAKGLLDLKTNADDDKARLNTLLGGCYSMDGNYDCPYPSNLI